MGITYTHEMGSLVHKDHLSTSDITCTHGWLHGEKMVFGDYPLGFGAGTRGLGGAGV